MRTLFAMTGRMRAAEARLLFFAGPNPEAQNQEEAPKAEVKNEVKLPADNAIDLQKSIGNEADTQIANADATYKIQDRQMNALMQSKETLMQEINPSAKAEAAPADTAAETKPATVADASYNIQERQQYGLMQDTSALMQEIKPTGAIGKREVEATVQTMEKKAGARSADLVTADITPDTKPADYKDVDNKVKATPVSLSKEVPDASSAATEEPDVVQEVFQERFDARPANETAQDWVAKNNADLAANNADYRLAVEGNKISIVRGEAVASVDAKADAGESSTAAKKKGFVENFTGDLDNSQKSEILSKAESLLNGKNPADMTQKQVNMLIESVRMQTGANVELSADKRSFRVTPPASSMEMLINKVMGAIAYFTEMFSKDSGIKLGEPTEESAEEEKKDEKAKDDATPDEGKDAAGDKQLPDWVTKLPAAAQKAYSVRNQLHFTDNDSTKDAYFMNDKDVLVHRRLDGKEETYDATPGVEKWTLLPAKASTPEAKQDTSAERPKPTPDQIQSAGLDSLKAYGYEVENQGDGTYIIDVPGTVWDMEIRMNNGSWQWQVEGADDWHAAGTPFSAVPSANWGNMEVPTNVRNCLMAAGIGNRMRPM